VTDIRLIAGGRSNLTYRLHVSGPGGTGCSCCAARRFAASCARRSGRDISRIGYYRAFGYVKLAVVLEGIHARYLQHQTMGEGFEQEGQAIPTLVARANQMLDADAR
jgi:aminoglycoside phosphotransferase (APT) family kinase protein